MALVRRTSVWLIISIYKKSLLWTLRTGVVGTTDEFAGEDRCSCRKLSRFRLAKKGD